MDAMLIRVKQQLKQLLLTPCCLFLSVSWQSLSVVLVGGGDCPQRFCHQCGKFEALTVFDGKKRLVTALQDKQPFMMKVLLLTVSNGQASMQ
jgi:hypothetical protein